MATPATMVLHRVKFAHRSGEIVLEVMLDPSTVQRALSPSTIAHVFRLSIEGAVKEAFTLVHGTRAPLVQYSQLEIEPCEPLVV